MLPNTIRIGVKSLLLHKLRTGLAMLGIFIGVTAVIWLVALGEGISFQAQEQIRELGATNIIVKSEKPPTSSTRNENQGLVVEYGLTRDDLDRIVDIPTITRAVPMREVKCEVRNGSRKAEVSLVGCTSAYFDINHLDSERGELLTDSHIESGQNVCVLGPEAAAALFPYEDPVGRKIQILVNNASDVLVVVGQTEARSASAAIGGSLAGRSYGFDIYIPISTFRWRIGDQIITARSGSFEGELVELNQITVTVDHRREVEETAGIIRVLLKKFHPGPDYQVVVPKELLRQAEIMRMMFNVLLVLIAGISLLVGGIGIMNIMLATVTERTREIGIRRALGARRSDIISQFLSEAIVLSATGGIVGVLFGFMCWPATRRVKGMIEMWLPEVWDTLPRAIQRLEPVMLPWSIIAAFSISVIVGVVFGLYPARRAAMMDPIEALRHE